MGTMGIDSGTRLVKIEDVSIARSNAGYGAGFTTICNVTLPPSSSSTSTLDPVSFMKREPAFFRDCVRSKMSNFRRKIYLGL